MYFIYFVIFTNTIQNRKNGLYGYINNRGDTIIACDYVHTFADTIKCLGFLFNQSIKRIICVNSNGEQLFYVFQFDNGPDYIKEGLFRIIDENNLIGFADTLGNIVIPFKYTFAYPFKEGKAKVTLTEGCNKHIINPKNVWFYIDTNGSEIKKKAMSNRSNNPKM